jgi:hypothetical protein
MDIIKRMDRSDKYLYFVIGVALVEIGVQIYSVIF